MTSIQAVCIQIAITLLIFPLWSIANRLQELVEILRNEMKKS